tara:strand:+ start:21 stop:509 length:489 start_codon:yes stop_codon:yes gene_type:complete
MNKIMALMTVVLISMAGCMSADNETMTEPEKVEPVMVYQGGDNHSYQFWNLAPMSVGNMSNLSNNNTTSEMGFNFNITLEVKAYFHEPLLWEQGYVNYTLSQGNETFFEVQLNHSQEWFYINLTNITGNITVEIQSTGSDDATTQEPGDFFIIRAEYKVYLD